MAIMRGKGIRGIWVGLNVSILAGACICNLQAAEQPKAPEKPKTSAKQPPKFSAEEQQRRRQLIKDRLNHQITELQKKRSAGTLSEEEKKRLNRMEQLANRLQKQGGTPPSGGVLASPAKPPNKGSNAPNKN